MTSDITPIGALPGGSQAPPFTCPHCGETFGWGADAVLLSVVSSAPFDEPAPCCGERIVGTINRQGEVTYA